MTCIVKKIHELTYEERSIWDNLIQSNQVLQKAFLTRQFITIVSEVHPFVNVAVFYRNSKPVAFFPFQYPSIIHKFFGIAERAGGTMNDCFGIIAEYDFSISPSRLLNACSLNGINFWGLDKIQENFGLKGENIDKGWIIDFSQGPDSYFKHLKETMRRKRKLQREYGPVTFSIIEDPKKRIEELTHIIQNKALQYERTNVKNIFKRDWTRLLLYRLNDQTNESCSLFLATLKINKTWLASFCGLRHKTQLHAWFPVYNVDFKKFAPGHLLYWELIKQSYAVGIQEINRGIGDTNAKKLLGNKETYYYRDIWTRHTAISFFYKVALSLKWRIME